MFDSTEASDEGQMEISYFYDTGRQGISQDEVLAGYTKWSHKYNKVSQDIYTGPKYAADYVYKYFGKDKTDVKILDVAAGTGLVGKKLQEAGFTNIDALEPVESMIQVAKQKNIYQHFISQILIDKGSTDIEDDTYDCVVSCGGMMEGHIPCCALNEMIRIVKPGGIVCIVMREEYLWTVAEYKERLEPLIVQLETDGKWKKTSRDILPSYFRDLNGVAFVYEVL